MKVAYFSPLPPERTGISEYSELLLPALRELVDVQVVARGQSAPRGADVCLYHVGNNPDAHGWIVEALRKRPGVVVLHDFVLHHLVAGLRSTRPGARLLLVGAEAPGFDLAGRVAGLGLEGVEREDYVDEDRLWSLMAACDVCLALRSPTMGETSGSAIRALVLGRPLVVSDVGWFRELPDEVALKVPVDQHEAETLAGALELLAENEPAREAMGA